MKKLLSSALVAFLLLAGCSANATSSEVTTVNVDYDEEGATTITLSEAITINGNGASLSDNIITISKPGTYIVSGNAEARIVVNCEAKGEVKIVLRSVSLTYSSGPAILVLKASNTYIITDENTESMITTTGKDADEGASAIKSHDDLIVCGKGTLTISSEGDGIHASDTLTVQDTTLNINATDDGLDVNDLITLNATTINITTADGAVESSNTGMGQGMPQGDMRDFDPRGMDGMQPNTNDGQMEPPSGEVPSDNATVSTSAELTAVKTTSTDTTEDEETKSKGIKCDGNIIISDSTITVNSADDAIHTNADFTTSNSTLALSASDDGIHADGSLTIESGIVDIKICYEGLEAMYIIINDGEVSIDASDDGINASNSNSTVSDMESDGSKLTINGGSVTVDADGDGIDSNGDVEINDGIVTVYGPTSEGDGALDYVGSFIMNGGELIASGSSGMAVMPSASSSVNSIMIDASGTTVIKDSDGNTILSFTSEKTYSNLVYSSTQLVSGETYTIYVDGNETTTVTIDSVNTDVSSASNMNHGIEGNPA